jgi:hypothetical protein
MLLRALPARTAPPAQAAARTQQRPRAIAPAAPLPCCAALPASHAGRARAPGCAQLAARRAPRCRALVRGCRCAHGAWRVILRVSAPFVQPARSPRAAAQAGSLPAPLKKIVTAFQMVPDPMQRYKQLLFYASKLKPLAEELHTADNKVQGCVSQVRARTPCAAPRVHTHVCVRGA